MKFNNYFQCVITILVETCARVHFIYMFRILCKTNSILFYFLTKGFNSKWIWNLNTSRLFNILQFPIRRVSSLSWIESVSSTNETTGFCYDFSKILKKRRNKTIKRVPFCPSCFSQWLFLFLFSKSLSGRVANCLFLI